MNDNRVQEWVLHERQKKKKGPNLDLGKCQRRPTQEKWLVH